MTDPNQPYGQPQNPQPQNGQPPYPQPQYSQPPFSQPPYSQPQYSVGQPPLSADEEKQWSTLVHLSGFLLGWLGPLIGYLVWKDRGPFIRWHTAQALNLQLTLLIGFVVSVPLMFVFIGFITYFGVALAGIVLMIIAATKANAGEFYRIPATIQFLK